jgi:hypothetical protein
MSAPQEKPPLLARIEVVLGNAIPVFGVIVLGWQAVTVVTLYVLDGWLCILGLGASVMIQNRGEFAAMVPQRYGRVRRGLTLMAAVAGVEGILSAFAVVPGLAVLGHMSRSPVEALTQTFGERGAWLSAAMLVASHALRIARGVRAEAEGIEALPPKQQMALFTYRMFLMMALAWLASPGFLSRFLVPVYVTAIAALFTTTDLYPRRFLARMRYRESGATGNGREARTAKSTRSRPTLPK